MNEFLELLKFFHVMSFVFMTIPLFNLIIVNERASLGSPFNYNTDRYMENLIKNGASRCYVFQTTVFVSGLLLLIFGDLGIEALWSNWVVLAKTILLCMLMGLLSVVHFGLQPKIESLLAEFGPESPVPDDLASKLKPYRAKRKQLATFCLFLVIVTIILGMQVYETFSPLLTVALVILAGLFALKVNKTLIKFGWV